MAELTDVLTRHPDCTVGAFEDGLAVLSPTDESTHSLDELGAFIWNLIDGERDLGEILDEVVADYDVTEDRAAKDLLAFAEVLQKAGLVTGP